MRQRLQLAAVPLLLLLATRPPVWRNAPPPSEPLTAPELAADARLDKLLLKAPSQEAQAGVCLDLAWNASEPDEMLRAAASRRLKANEPRVVSAAIAPRLRSRPPAERIPMLNLLADLHSRLGGVDAGVDVLLVDQIRSSDPGLAKAAIDIAVRLGLKEAYIPFREIVSNPGSPLRAEAIEGIVRIGDQRALNFFVALLDADAAPRDEIYRGLAGIGRPASLFLKTKLLDKNPPERQRALDTLLGMVSPEDLSALYMYLERFPPEGELKTRLYETIAHLEAAQAAGSSTHE